MNWQTKKWCLSSHSLCVQHFSISNGPDYNLQYIDFMKVKTFLNVGVMESTMFTKLSILVFPWHLLGSWTIWVEGALGGKTMMTVSSSKPFCVYALYFIFCLSVYLSPSLCGLKITTFLSVLLSSGCLNKSTTDCITLTMEMYFLRFLGAKRPKPRCWLDCVLSEGCTNDPFLLFLASGVFWQFLVILGL